jgi:hypothetical protein
MTSKTFNKIKNKNKISRKLNNDKVNHIKDSMKEIWNGKTKLK